MVLKDSASSPISPLSLTFTRVSPLGNVGLDANPGAVVAVVVIKLEFDAAGTSLLITFPKPLDFIACHLADENIDRSDGHRYYNGEGQEEAEL
jgi:hypothetical protein